MRCRWGVPRLAGTSFPIDRRFVAKLLGFTRITENSIDTVSDRDFLVEFVSAAALVMTHLSRLSEELDSLVLEFGIQYDPPAE